MYCVLEQYINEHDHEMLKSHIADQPTASLGRDRKFNGHKTAINQDGNKSKVTKKTIQVKQQSLFPNEMVFKTRKNTKYCITKQRPITKQWKQQT